jgi:beta-1,4-mannosyl-glycoprotein beta-1,4-N-acetylglucosaminyltransferase
MLFDCFLYNGEKECLDIRIAELAELDVLHLAVQANKTFTNQHKVVYDISKGNVVDLVVTDMPDGDDPWARERHQRNSIMRGLSRMNIADSDFVIISDADEIPKAEAIKKYHSGMAVTALVMDKFGYWLNCVEGFQSWKIAKILTYGKLKESSSDLIRNSGQENYIENAGHHFSYLGSKETILNKLASFSHTECNTDELRSQIEYKRETGQSLWGNDFWKIVPIDSTFPKYVQDHQHDTLKHLIKQV